MKRQATLGTALLTAAILFIMTSSAAGAIVHVKWDSPGPTFDGSSWTTAHHNVQAGLDAATSGDEVWVARGTYVENITLKDGVGLYGGFAGTESARDQRNWTVNVTLIDGGGSGNVVTGANISTIDGFTIRNGSDGIYCSYSSPTITNNTIVGNSYHGISCHHSSSTITNNTIVGNSYDGMLCLDSSPTMTNNTIVGNSDGIDCRSGSPTIANNIFAFNARGIRRYWGAPVLSHNDVYGNTTDYSGISPGVGDISQDPQFACFELGDLHIQPTSPCRDAGDNSALGLADEDMDGQARNDGGGVDIGADESYGEEWPPCTPRIIHVDRSASAGGDGTTWANAYQTIGEAVGDVIRNGGAEIWVAEGAYSENVRLVPFAHMYGGFAGMESQRSERDCRNNVTVIDGGGSGDVVTGANSSTIDGFTIRNGGTGVDCYSSSPTITNNTIVGNSGEGICCWWSSPTIANNTIVGNGEGIVCCPASPTITNNTIVGNSDGIDCRSGSPTITNNILAFNARGIYRDGGAPVLSHNDVYGNTTDYDGISPGMGDISEDPQFACFELGDLHIQPTSPCRDAGDNSASGLADEDMDGQARNDGGGVDIGVDESYGEQWPPCTPRIIHVDWSASAGGNGTSWANAYRTIGEAVGDVIRRGGAEIWVAQGVYSENVRLAPFAYLYGGFAGMESQRSERDWRSNVTVIDGGTSRVVIGANISTIDGFTIRNGSHGIFCSYSSPTITNNMIVGNSYHGILCHHSCPIITNNTIAGNLGGIWCLDNSSPTITNSTIVGNSWGIPCSSSSPTITNNILAFNTTGIYRDGGAPVLSHNDVYGNTTDYDAITPGIGDISADPLFLDLPGGDFHLRFDSPCIDTGTNEDAPSEDADGNPRPVDGDCDGIAVTDIGAYEYQPICVQVDVLPRNDANVIRLKPKRLIPVAILSDDAFDARWIDPMSVVFGPGRATEVHGRAHWEDVNRDGLVDLLLHFSCAESGIAPGDESVTLYGRLINGERIVGSDRIRVIVR